LLLQGFKISISTDRNVNNEFIPHILITMGKNQNTGSHRTKIIFCEIKIIFHHFGSLAGFPGRVIVL
jgi:hypothetical protein